MHASGFIGGHKTREGALQMAVAVDMLFQSSTCIAEFPSVQALDL